ncbi:hypothetical protein JTE90_006052 [Oedothorax gibbosus]|uniref:Uncharacterized protein n=1 Tax=Oedothorax gibbosus TaxID=931172 RepID=A0AAV6V5W0_9ARAC|nr:hypothetical protein JTE90_006052 [Oedothorax gibbosus]
MPPFKEVNEIILLFVSYNEFVDSSSPIKPICHPEFGRPCLFPPSNIEDDENGAKAKESNTLQHGDRIVAKKQQIPEAADGHGLHANDFLVELERSRKKHGSTIRFRRKERKALFASKLKDEQKPISGFAYQNENISSEFNSKRNANIDSAKEKKYIPARDSIWRKKRINSIMTNPNNFDKVYVSKLDENVKHLKQDKILNNRKQKNTNKVKEISTNKPVTLSHVSAVKPEIDFNDSSVLVIISTFPFIVKKSSANEYLFEAHNLTKNDERFTRGERSIDFRNKINGRRNRRFIKTHSNTNQIACGKNCKRSSDTLTKADTYSEFGYNPDNKPSISLSNSFSKKADAFKMSNHGSATSAFKSINQSSSRNQTSSHNKPVPYSEDKVGDPKSHHPIERRRQFQKSDNIETRISEFQETHQYVTVTASPLLEWNEGIFRDDDPRSKKSELQIYERLDKKNPGTLKSGANREQYVYGGLNDGGSRDLRGLLSELGGFRENGKSLKSNQQRTSRVHDHSSPAEKRFESLVKPEPINDPVLSKVNKFTRHNKNGNLKHLKYNYPDRTSLELVNVSFNLSHEIDSSNTSKIISMESNNSELKHQGIKYSKEKAHKENGSNNDLNYSPIKMKSSKNNLLKEINLSRKKRQQGITQVNGDIENADKKALIIVLDKSALPLEAYLADRDPRLVETERFNKDESSGRLFYDLQNHKQNPFQDKADVVTSSRDGPGFIRVYPIPAGSSQQGSKPAFGNRRPHPGNIFRFLRTPTSRVNSNPTGPQRGNTESQNNNNNRRPKSRFQIWFETRVLRGNSKYLGGGIGNGPAQIWYIILPIEKAHEKKVPSKKRDTLQPKEGEDDKTALLQRELEGEDTENPLDVIPTPVYFHLKSRSTTQVTPRGAKYKPDLRQFERFVSEDQIKLNNETDMSDFIDWLNSQWIFFPTAAPVEDELPTVPDNITGDNNAKPTRIPPTIDFDLQNMTEQSATKHSVQGTSTNITATQASDNSNSENTTKEPDLLLGILNQREPKQLAQQTTNRPSTSTRRPTSSTRRPTSSTRRPTSSTKKPTTKKPPSKKPTRRPKPTGKTKKPVTKATKKPWPIVNTPTYDPWDNQQTVTPDPWWNNERPVTPDPWWDNKRHINPNPWWNNQRPVNPNPWWNNQRPINPNPWWNNQHKMKPEYQNPPWGSQQERNVGTFNPWFKNPVTPDPWNNQYKKNPWPLDPWWDSKHKKNPGNLNPWDDQRIRNPMVYDLQSHMNRWREKQERNRDPWWNKKQEKIPVTPGPGWWDKQEKKILVTPDPWWDKQQKKIPVTPDPWWNDKKNPVTPNPWWDKQQKKIPVTPDPWWNDKKNPNPVTPDPWWNDKKNPVTPDPWWDKQQKKIPVTPDPWWNDKKNPVTPDLGWDKQQKKIPVTPDPWWKDKKNPVTPNPWWDKQQISVTPNPWWSQYKKNPATPGPWEGLQDKELWPNPVTPDPWWDHDHKTDLIKKLCPCEGKPFHPSYPWRTWYRATTSTPVW